MSPRKRTSSPAADDFTSMREQIYDLAGHFNYLGNPTLIDRVSWVYHNRKDILVLNSDYKAFLDQQALQRADPSVAEPILRPAVLTAVMAIDDDKFYLTPTGGYLPKGQGLVKDFSKVKLTCKGGKAVGTVFEQDYSTVEETARLLVASSKKTAIQKGFFNSNEHTLTFRHELFQERSELPEDDGHADVLPSICSIEHWPVDDADIQEELNRLVATHKTVPIPAYGLDETLITPDKYSAQLQRAVVVMQFTLSHTCIRSSTSRIGSSDAYTPDIHNIQVIVKPQAKAAAKKVELRLTNPCSPSALKRVRTE